MSQTKIDCPAEILEEFYNESIALKEELENILEALEEDLSNASLLEKFGQTIDRIMGAAKSIGANETGKICELGKIIGYKSSQSSDLKLREVVVAILADSLDILDKLLLSVKNNSVESLDGLNTKAFVTRLSWLAEKFKNIERASVAFEGEKASSPQEQKSIEDILKGFGL